jgi:hypothetical protein
MTDLFADENTSAKTIIIGDSGDGKTGATAALIALGYKGRFIDSDNGRKCLRSLLTDEAHYPYASWMKKNNIQPDVKYFSVPLSVGMKTVFIKGPNDKSSSERVLGPKDAKGWNRIINQLENWKEPDNTSLGHFESWDENTFLDFDCLTSISRHAYYFNQELNGRLGAREEGFTHQRDVGGAQSQLRRLFEMLAMPDIKCNIILTCHIYRMDDSRGYNATPEEIRLKNPDAVVEVKGYPLSIGMALSKRTGSFFNDGFVMQCTGVGRHVRRSLCTTPITIDNVTVGAKNSVWLEPEYNITTGLGQIFAALRYQPPPADFVNYCNTWKPDLKSPTQVLLPAPTPPKEPMNGPVVSP